MAESQDIQRLRLEYQDRKRNYAQSEKYSRFDSAHNFEIQGRKRFLLSLLRKHDLNSLQQLKLVEIGFGSGGILAEYFSLGVSLTNLFGIDLSFDRIKDAKRQLPTSHIHNATLHIYH